MKMRGMGLHLGFRFAGKPAMLVDNFHIHLPIYNIDRGFPSQPCLIAEGCQIASAISQFAMEAIANLVD